MNFMKMVVMVCCFFALLHISAQTSLESSGPGGSTSAGVEVSPKKTSVKMKKEKNKKKDNKSKKKGKDSDKKIGAANLPKDFKVLFIGNSYTYVNSVPVIFAQLGKSRGRYIIWDMVAPGGYSFESHMLNPPKKNAKDCIAQKKWDIVVLQDQSQTPAMMPPTSTLRGAKLLKAEIDKIGAQICYYMTPAHYEPDANNKHMWAEMQDMLNNGYNAAAKETGGIMAPVGEAFRMNYDEDYTRMIHSNDHSHFSKAGSYLAAMVLYCAITGEDAQGLPNVMKLDTKLCKKLQSITDATLQKYGTHVHEQVTIKSVEDNRKFFEEFEKNKQKKMKGIK